MHIRPARTQIAGAGLLGAMLIASLLMTRPPQADLATRHAPVRPALPPSVARIAPAAVTGPASAVGQWAGPFNWPLVAIHAALLRTGEVLVVDDYDGGGGSARLWNPQTGAFAPVPNTASNFYCGGHAVLADGRLLFVGGQYVPFFGIADANTFDPVSRAWALMEPMFYRRWYPTATMLPDGRVLVVSGDQAGAFTNADVPEVYDPVADTWTPLPSARLVLPNYPFMFTLPDGRVLQAGADEADTPTRILDVQAGTWITANSAIVPGGSAVMYRPGQVMKTGSSAYVGIDTAPAVRDAYVMDAAAAAAAAAAPTWRRVADMAFPRAHHNLTALPTGDVLVTGGGRTPDGVETSQAVYAAEVWSPATEQWTTLASMAVPRLYHSTALLLPDARVLVAGSGRWGPDQHSAEIFSPPYLFRGSRPTIANAPASAAYGSSFFVGTPDGARIASVALVRPGAVTHAFDQDQRYVGLSFTQANGGLNIQAPPGGGIAPPGYYMLFLVDTNGVPSIARFVQLHAGGGPVPPTPTTSPTPTTTVTASPTPAATATATAAAPLPIVPNIFHYLPIILR